MANAFPQLFLFSKEIISGTILPSSFRRALFRQEKGPLKPTTLGSMFSSGTATSSMKIMPVWEALRENLPSIFGAERPGTPFSRMKPLSPPSVWAQTTKTSAMGEFVIQFLLPLTIQTLASESHRALVSMWPGSDPWFGSVRQKQPINSPEARRGRYFSRWASLPKSQMGDMTRLDWTDMAERMAESTRSHSLTIKP